VERNGETPLNKEGNDGEPAASPISCSLFKEMEKKLGKIWNFVPFSSHFFVLIFSPHEDHKEIEGNCEAQPRFLTISLVFFLVKING